MASRPPDLLFVPAHVLPIVHPRRSVVTVHDLGYLYWPGAHSRRRWWYLHLSTLYNARAATQVIADSAATRDDLVARYAIPAGKIRVVHLGHRPEFRPLPEADVAAVRARYGIRGQYVLAVGTLQPRKNLGRLFEAFVSAREQTGSECKLLVAGGSGHGGEAIRKQAASKGDAVRLLGYVPDADVPALMGGALALAFPSLHEGFGLPALEAMACGTPVVASDTTSLPEVVGDAGLLVPPTDVAAVAAALARVVGDAGLRADLRRRGLERAARFTWRRCAEETLRVLEEAAAIGRYPKGD
jgi:glycosyltransferase involved in cell wall biosynthesis